MIKSFTKHIFGILQLSQNSSTYLCFCFCFYIYSYFILFNYILYCRNYHSKELFLTFLLEENKKKKKNKNRFPLAKLYEFHF